MLLQNYFEEVQETFPNVAERYFGKIIIEAQKKFIADSGILVKGAALSGITSAKSFSLPADFVRLKRVDYLNSSNEIIYEPLMHYLGEDTISFDSTTETISVIPGTIANIVLVYIYNPVDPTLVTDPVQELSVPSQFDEGVMAWVWKKLYQRYGMVQRQSLINESVIVEKDWKAVKYWTDYYNEEVRKAIKYINSQDSSAVVIRAIESAGDIPQYTVNPSP